MSRLSTFLEKYPNAEIRGGQIVAIRDAIGEVAAPYFARAGLLEAQPEEWYDMTTYLNLIYEIVKNEPDVMFNLIALGIKVVEHAVLPPEIDSVEKGLRAMQRGWQMNSRNAQEVIWEVQKLDDNQFVVTNSSPFPPDQEYGVLYGFVRRFSGNRPFQVVYENLADREDEDNEFTKFLVTLN